MEEIQNEVCVVGSTSNGTGGETVQGDKIADPEENFEAQSLVSELDLLREKIIDYAMRNQNGSLCAEYIANLRLVGKSWMVSLTKVLIKSHEPLFTLTLKEESAQNGTPFTRSPKSLLDQFVALVGRRIGTVFPTFCLQIMETAFKLKNYESLYACLLKCGQGLVELELHIPRNGGTLPCIFSNIYLPALTKMTVDLMETELIDATVTNAIIENSANVTFLLQSLLNKNDSLKELEFLHTNGMGFIPMGFQYICLPNSITDLILDCKIQDHELEILSRCVLPNLHSLDLAIPNTVYPAGLVNRVLQNLKKSLVSLETCGVIYSGPPNNANFVSFPVMEKLQELQMYSINLVLESPLSALGHYFPKLEKLILKDQTQSMFHKWTSGSPAVDVHTLELQLVDDNFAENEVGFHLPVIMEDMQRVHLTFPNLSSLLLILTSTETCGLKYLFMEMKQLKYLGLVVTESKNIASSDCWDSILCGLPIEIVIALQANPELWRYADFKNEEMPSIVMLMELETLRLGNSTSDDEDEPTEALISDLAFKFALMKMANLKNIYLEGRFKVSEISKIAWEKQRREITYTA